MQKPPTVADADRRLRPVMVTGTSLVLADPFIYKIDDRQSQAASEIRSNFPNCDSGFPPSFAFIAA